MVWCLHPGCGEDVARERYGSSVYEHLNWLISKRPRSTFYVLRSTTELLIRIEGLRTEMTTQAPLVVIVGGGFGGLAAAKGLKRSPVNVLLIDRSNHHVFQPLLYQVARSVLAAGQIASPIRSLLSLQANTSVMLGNVTGVDAASKKVIVDV